MSAPATAHASARIGTTRPSGRSPGRRDRLYLAGGRPTESSSRFLDPSRRPGENWAVPSYGLRATHSSDRSPQDLRQPSRAGRTRPRRPCRRGGGGAGRQRRRQDHFAQDPGNPGASDARYRDHRGPRLRERRRARPPRDRARRPQLSRVRGPDRRRKPDLLGHARGPSTVAGRAHRRARDRRARPRRRRAGPHVLGGHEAPALPRALRPGSAACTLARRAVHGARPAWQEVAGRASGIVQNGRRRDRHDDAQLRPRAGGRRPDCDPRRRRHRPRHASRSPFGRRRASALRPARGGSS